MKFIFISGASGSGKTTISEALFHALSHSGASVSSITMDDYSVEAPSDIVDIQKYRQETNFDRVEMCDLKLLHQHILALVNGNPIEKPIFDFPSNKRKAYEIVKPCDYMIIEGIFALYFAKNLKEQIDKVTVFVGQSSYLNLLQRRGARDVNERNFTLDQVLLKERRFVGPGFFQTIASSKTGVDIDITNDMKIEGKIDPIQAGVQEILAFIHKKNREPAEQKENLQKTDLLL